jgi:tetratricopeptide (TPR) repeat protein
MQIFQRLGSWSIRLVCIILFFSSGCSPWHADRSSLTLEESEAIFLDKVPFLKQETYQCGPSSLAMVLAWSGLELSPDDLADEVYTEKLHGSIQPSLISAARQHGRIAYPIQGLKELYTELNQDHPVIILQNLGLSWYPRWHYAVAIGYADFGRSIILHTGTKKAVPVSVGIFNNTWSHSDYWGLLVLPPDELPATVTEEKYLNAVAGLERTKQFEAAVIGYKSAINRWPESLAAWMGLGNSFYAQGDLSSARDALEQAFKLHPSNGMPLNNLSQVLWEQGEKEQALLAILHAIELGGPLKHVYKETLQSFVQFKQQNGY